MSRAANALCAVAIAASIVYLAVDDSNNIRRNEELLKKCSVEPVTSASTPKPQPKLQWKKRALVAKLGPPLSIVEAPCAQFHEWRE